MCALHDRDGLLFIFQGASLMTASDHRTIRIIMTVVAMITAFGMFVACSQVNAADMHQPHIPSCETIAQHAVRYNITNTPEGRARAVVLAEAHGVSLSQAQLRQLFACLPPAK